MTVTSTYPRVIQTPGGLWACEYDTGEVDSSIMWDEESATLCAGSHSADGQWLRICDDCGEPAGLWQPPWDDLEPFFSCTDENCSSASNSPNPALPGTDKEKGDAENG